MFLILLSVGLFAIVGKGCAADWLLKEKLMALRIENEIFPMKILNFLVWSWREFEGHFLLFGASDRWLGEVEDVIGDGVNLFDEVVL